MVGLFYRSIKYLTSSGILYLYKKHIKLKMEYAAIFGPEMFNPDSQVQNPLCDFMRKDIFSTLQLFPHTQRRNPIASLAI